MKSKVADLERSIKFVRGGIASRVLHKNEISRTILFAFDRNQQLSEHTASVPAVMHFLKGKAKVTLGKRKIPAKAGTWIHMPPQFLHAISAETKTVMLLTLFDLSKAKAQNSCK
jgi:quercetin dioxygenase-like cupin family protein